MTTKKEPYKSYVTMEYNRPEQGFEVYCCSNCQTNYVCTENENFEWSEHDTEEEAIKALNELAEKINNAN